MLLGHVVLAVLQMVLGRLVAMAEGALRLAVRDQRLVGRLRMVVRQIMRRGASMMRRRLFVVLSGGQVMVGAAQGGFGQGGWLSGKGARCGAGRTARQSAATPMANGDAATAEQGLLAGKLPLQRGASHSVRKSAEAICVIACYDAAIPQGARAMP